MDYVYSIGGKDMDSRIDVQKLEVLKKEIDQELDMVEKLLNEVKDCWMTQPQEDDDVLKAIYNVGNAIDGSWRVMCSSFKQAGDKFSDFINEAKKTISNVVEKVTNID